MIFFDLGPFDDIDLTYARQKLKMVVKSVPDTIHADLLTLPPFDTGILPDTGRQAVKQFDFDVTWSVIRDPEANNIRLPVILFRDRAPFEFYKSVQEFFRAEGRGKT